MHFTTLSGLSPDLSNIYRMTSEKALKLESYVCYYQKRILGISLGMTLSAHVIRWFSLFCT